MDEKTLLLVRAAAGGLQLPDDRVDALLPGLRRLETTLQRLRECELDFEEPALIFDTQAAGGSGGGQ
jgi:hypothetical protein